MKSTNSTKKLVFVFQNPQRTLASVFSNSIFGFLFVFAFAFQSMKEFLQFNSSKLQISKKQLIAKIVM